MAPLSASATGDDQVAPGSPAPESKIQDGKATGAEFAPNAYFVQFAAPSVAEGGSLQAVQSQRAQFLADADEAGVEVEVTSEFSTLWSGVTVMADDASLTTLASSDAVEAIFPVGIIDAPERPEQADYAPELSTAVGMTGVDVVQSELGFTGEGVRIGIIDSGVDYDHPDFGGSGEPGGTTFPTERVAFGYDFVGDSFNASPSAGANYQPKPFPDGDPDDCGGHGTHVAGISSANGEVTGVAPDSTIGAYRVFGCSGSTTADIMLRAMEQSLEDEMDVVNLSIGSAFSAWAEYPTARATDALAREGVVVVASIGNSGANGLHSAGAPGVGRDTIGVGSVDNVAYEANFGTDDEGNEIPYTVGTPAPEPPAPGTTGDVVAVIPPAEENQACAANPFTPEQIAQIEGNWLLLKRGGCTFHTKANAGQQAGAAGVILYNNVAGAFNPSLTGEPPITVPVIAITQADGARMAERSLAGEDVTFTFEEGTTRVPSPTGGLMSAFSSFGTMADTTFKPDLSAPGGQIYSTYPLEIQPYATLSGTSMSAPHVAGAVALMLEAEPDLGVEEVKLRLQSTSTQLPLSVNRGAGLEVVHRQGAGMIQVDDAILADVVVQPGLVQLGQQLAGETSTQTVTVRNLSDSPKTFAVEHVPAIGTYGTSNDWYYGFAEAAVQHPDVVRVPVGGSAQVELTITSPAADDAGVAPIYGGYVHLTSGAGDDAEVYSIAYGGFAQDLQDIEVLADQIDGERNVTQELPALGFVETCDTWLGITCYDEDAVYGFVDGYRSFSMTQQDHPNFLVHFEHQARNMEWEVFEANEDGTAGESLGTAASVDYLGRSASRNAFTAYPWDGMVINEDGARVRVASGDYVMQIRVTKASAWNDDREAGVETYTSQAFGIDWSAEGQVDRPAVDRILGHNRFSTASELAVERFEPGVDTVYIANGYNFPDAVSGGALAAGEEAPVLLTRPDSLPPATRMALQTLRPERIVVLGGEMVVDEDVETALAGYAVTVDRLYGDDRYRTARAISAQWEASDVVFLASGEDFPDALTAAAAAGVEGAPVLLTRAGALPDAAVVELQRLSPSTVYVIGGEDAISLDVAEDAAQYADEVVRIGGTNRYGTASLVGQQFFPTPAPEAFLATGLDFPDALAAAPAAAMNNGPVLLTRLETVPTATVEALNALRAQTITLVGGYEAISLGVQETLEGHVYP